MALFAEMKQCRVTQIIIILVKLLPQLLSCQPSCSACPIPVVPAHPAPVSSWFNLTTSVAATVEWKSVPSPKTVFAGLNTVKFQVCARKLLSPKLQDFVGWQNPAQSVFGIGLSTPFASLGRTGLKQMLSEIPHLAPHSVNALDVSSARLAASHVMVRRSQLAWAGVQLVPAVVQH